MFSRSTMIILAITTCLCASTVSNSQTETDLKHFFEGKLVTVNIDMPASSKGIDLYVDKSQILDFDEYSNRIKEHGISLYVGDEIMVTKIKLKKKHIEFQLGGGGYGTFGDESSHVSVPYLSKTEREKKLEKDIKTVDDTSNKKKMEAELRDLRKAREVEQKRLRMEAEQLKATKEDQILSKARQSGSRFNIRFDQNIGRNQIYPETLMDLLKNYLSFDSQLNLSTSTLKENKNTELRKGLLWEEVAVLLGAPSKIDQRKEGILTLMICKFEKADQIITAEFVEGVLIKYSIQSK